MSKYTTEVRFICEQQAGLSESGGYNDVTQVISLSRGRIFDFPYPIFDESYRSVLETKILMHYYTREIGEETYGLWKLRLRSRLNEIMPYYNKLYESELIEFNPLWDTDLTTDRDVVLENAHEDETVTDNTDRRTGTDSVAETSSRSSEMGGEDVSTAGGQDRAVAGGTDTTGYTRADKDNTWDLFSDTPQGGIAGIQGAEDDPSLGDNGYLTNARHIIGDTTGSTGSGNTNYGRTDTTNYGRTDTTEYGRTNEEEFTRNNTLTHNTQDKFDGTVNNEGGYTDTTDYLERVTGYRGRSPIESIMKLRESFLNIDLQIIRELRDLFFNLW